VNDIVDPCFVFPRLMYKFCAVYTSRGKPKQGSTFSCYSICFAG